MPEPRAEKGWFASLPNDSVVKTVLIATLLCLVCSVVVSATAVALRPLQERNAVLAMKQEILRVAGLYDPTRPIEASFSQVETRIIDLETGQIATDIDPETFDFQKAAHDPASSVAISPENDIASLGRRARYMPVYVVRRADKPNMIILPVSGYGLWSTMYGFLALDEDGTTVSGITFYQDAETPGLGAEINNPRWQNNWVGKQVYDDKGKVALHVIKGAVTAGRPGAVYEIDGLSGATLTANGVSNLIRYWLGDQAYGPFLERIRSGESVI
ncbi:MAG: Na(+)-translocating NADH-quinone reductase subunit C [Gammaproteobacteria bacterium]